MSKAFNRAEAKALKKAFPKGMGVRILPTSKPSTATQVKKLKSVVASMKPETKYVANTVLADAVQVAGSGLLYNGVAQTFGWVNVGGQFIPPLSQGTAENQRVGNIIRPKKLVLKYSLYANPSTESGSTPNNNPYINLPFYVRVIVFRHRYANDDFSQTGILDLGASNADISGNVESMFEPYNRDEYIIAYSKTHFMQPQRHQLTGAGNFTGQNHDNKARTIVIKRANITLPKKLRYNDSTSQTGDAGWFLAVCCVNSDGSPILNAGATVHQRVRLNAETYMTFTDS